ncbi:MAG TPA: hypothetical protein DCZ92_04825 [Elusimicrobia bacterium]|nr:MAG: hypothetical protein A2016_03535 [Elusimicrobia bacterium GWF2_62_30]HBA60132.1 hypothetical protein [Elusimicrobiota bacterium]
MTARSKWSVVILVFAAAALFYWLKAGSSPSPKPAGALPEVRDLSRLEVYNFDPASSLAERITAIPADLLQHYRKMDGTTAYEAYQPSAADKALVLEYFALLPPVYRKVFEARCVGLYFVDSFMGNGITSWVAGPGGEVYFHITFNAVTLTKSLSEILTERERSCFKPGKTAITVEAGEKYRGFAYVLFHEATHGLDYALGLTPWADNEMPENLRPAAPLAGVAFRKYWAAYGTPVSSLDFSGRNNITFYGLGGGPKIPADEAAPLYAGFARTPFVSLYGSMSWAEDLSELVTMRLLTRKLAQPYRITLGGEGQPVVLEPLRAKGAAARADEILKLLDSVPAAALAALKRPDKVSE